MPLQDWFLTAEERGNPALLHTHLVRGKHGRTAYSRQNVLRPAGRPRWRRSGEGDHLFFTDWRGDPDEQMRDDGPDHRRAVRAAAKRGVVVKGLLWRSHLDKLAYSEEENRNLGEDDRGGRRRGAARPAGPARRLAPPEAGVLRHPGRAGAGHRLRRRHRPVPQPARRRRAPRRPAGGARWPRAYGAASALARRAARGARPGRRRARPVVPGALDATRPRWTSTARSPPCSDKLRHADLQRRPAAAAAARPAAVRPASPSRCCAPIRRCARRTTSRRTASGPSPAATPRRSSGPAG